MLLLKSLGGTLAGIGDVRGKGLMLGVELVKDRDGSKDPAKTETAEVFESLKGDVLYLSCTSIL